jgi:hypothetical protein
MVQQKRGKKKRYYKKKNVQPLVIMLNDRRLNPFKYDVREVLSSSKIEPEQANPLLASLVAVASRKSIKDAKDFLDKKKEEGIIEEDVHKAISRLLDRYSKRR